MEYTIDHLENIFNKIGNPATIPSCINNEVPFGKFIQQLRLNNKWSPQEFADYLEIDVNLLYKIEDHFHMPTPFLTIKIADMLRLDPEELCDYAKKCKLRAYIKELNTQYSRAFRKYWKDS